jgi:hypothetical protein
MQPYWVFDEPIAVEQSRELQVLLIEVMGADKSNKNPSRVFRLAGGWHIKPDREPAKTEIVSDSGIRYSYGDLCDRLLDLLPSTPVTEPATEPATTPAPTPTTESATEPEPAVTTNYKDIKVPVPVAVPLECALGSKSKEYLSGVGNQRNTSMAVLARDLLGTEAEFRHLYHFFKDVIEIKNVNSTTIR